MTDETRTITANEIDESFVPTARSTAASIELDGEAVVFSEDTGALHLLNPTATVIWSCFDGSGTLGELIDDLAVGFNVDRAVVRQDVLELAREVGHSGLLEGVEAAPGRHDLAYVDHFVGPVGASAAAQRAQNDRQD